MGTAVFLVLPEALHLIQGVHNEVDGHEDHSGHGHRLLQDEHEDHDDNSEGIAFAKWGCGILGGFLLPPFLALFFHHGVEGEEGDSDVDSEEECQSCMEKEAVSSGQPCSIHDADEEVSAHNQGLSLAGEIEEAREVEVDLTAVQTKSFIDYRLITTVIIGDFFCNFADGLFIGAAFMGCSWATAISVTAIALFHEIPQELADFVILTRYAGLGMTKACILNFVTGLAVCVGGLVVLAVRPSDKAIGVILAIAAGVYFNLAAVEVSNSL